MKLLFLCTLFLFVSTIISSQKINQEISVENQQPFLVGEINVEGLSFNSYKNWFLPNLASYTANTTNLEQFKDKLAEHQILIFMGTWCGDSKREVPRFIKILESVDFPMKNLKIVALDKRKEKYKKSPQGEEWGLNIRRVPTFIFYKNGREINRIIETPVTTLEEDILKIILQNQYTPNYSTSLHFD
ncbi:TlpA family protein disulfide reductase [Maribacter arcticus]|uniref:Thiol-disulfide isomerase or thioredoxin n=1 Tax=Maribacter arcticus TaxID=561365 RepID=A0A1T5EMH6_9FLAO|nr:thioredoxin family protein [Maribacter arcticus]SKB85184.1 Thiol-disulfide isomerase or thioredoxin [Maribacter arcticus]